MIILASSPAGVSNNSELGQQQTPVTPPASILKNRKIGAQEPPFTNDLLRISLMDEIFKKKFLQFLRIEVEGVTEVYY